MQFILDYFWIIVQSSKDRILSLGGNKSVLDILFGIKAAWWLVYVWRWYSSVDITERLLSCGFYDTNKSQGFLNRDLFVWIWFCSWKEIHFYLLTFCSHSSSDTSCLIFSIWQKPLFSSILHLDSQSVRTAFPCSCTDFIWLLVKIVNPCFTESCAQRGTVLRLERLLCNWKLLLQRTLEWLPHNCL